MISAMRATSTALRIQPALQRTAEVSHNAATLVSVLLLTPGAMMAFVFGLWRLGQDMGFAGNFLISEGLFSHWLVWMALSAGLKATSTMAVRNGDAKNIEEEAGDERN